MASIYTTLQNTKYQPAHLQPYIWQLHPQEGEIDISFPFLSLNGHFCDFSNIKVGILHDELKL